MSNKKSYYERPSNAKDALNLIRQIRKERNAKTTVGLINRDTGTHYYVRDGRIYCVDATLKSSFNFDEYFKNSKRILTKGKTCYFVDAEPCESGRTVVNTWNCPDIEKGTFVASTKAADTFYYSIIETSKGLKIIPSMFVEATKDSIKEYVKRQYERAIKNKQEELNDLKENLKEFLDN